MIKTAYDTIPPPTGVDPFMRKLMKRYGIPRLMITDNLCSYAAAKRGMAPSLEHLSHKGLNIRAEGVAFGHFVKQLTFLDKCTR